MEETPTLKSELSIENLLSEVCLVLGFCGIIWWINCSGGKSHDDEILNIVFTTLIATYSLYRAALILRMDSIALYQNRLERRSILGYSKPPILFSDITCWAQNVTYLPATLRLSLFTKQNNRYMISNACYNNYNEMKELLAANIGHSLEKENAIYNRLYNKDAAVTFIVALIGLGMAGTTFFQNPPKPIISDPAVWIGLVWFLLFSILTWFAYKRNPYRKK